MGHSKAEGRGLLGPGFLLPGRLYDGPAPRKRKLLRRIFGFARCRLENGLGGWYHGLAVNLFFSAAATAPSAISLAAPHFRTDD
jgi:hypothetical protein